MVPVRVRPRSPKLLNGPLVVGKGEEVMFLMVPVAMCPVGGEDCLVSPTGILYTADQLQSCLFLGADGSDSYLPEGALCGDRQVWELP